MPLGHSMDKLSLSHTNFNMNSWSSRLTTGSFLTLPWRSWGRRDGRWRHALMTFTGIRKWWPAMWRRSMRRNSPAWETLSANMSSVMTIQLIGELFFLHLLDRPQQHTGIFFNPHIVHLRYLVSLAKMSLSWFFLSLYTILPENQRAFLGKGRNPPDSWIDKYLKLKYS